MPLPWQNWATEFAKSPIRMNWPIAAAEILGRRAGRQSRRLRHHRHHSPKRSHRARLERTRRRSLAGTLHFRDYGDYIDELKRGETVVCVDAEHRSSYRSPRRALKAISAQSFVNMPVTEEDGFVALLYLNNATPRVWAELRSRSFSKLPSAPERPSRGDGQKPRYEKTKDACDF